MTEQPPPRPLTGTRSPDLPDEPYADLYDDLTDPDVSVDEDGESAGPRWLGETRVSPNVAFVDVGTNVSGSPAVWNVTDCGLFLVAGMPGSGVRSVLSAVMEHVDAHVRDGATLFDPSRLLVVSSSEALVDAAGLFGFHVVSPAQLTETAAAAGDGNTNVGVLIIDENRVPDGPDMDMVRAAGSALEAAGWLVVVGTDRPPVGYPPRREVLLTGPVPEGWAERILPSGVAWDADDERVVWAELSPGQGVHAPVSLGRINLVNLHPLRTDDDGEAVPYPA